MVEYLRRRADRDGQSVVPVRASQQPLLPPRIPNVHRAPPRRLLLPARSLFLLPRYVETPWMEWVRKQLAPPTPAKELV